MALYGDTDFNQAYPLARGISPPAVALFAVLVVGESLERLADRRTGRAQRRAAGGRAAGIRPDGDGQRRGGAARSRRAVGLAVLTGLSIATYTVLDGLGVRRCGTPFGYGGWLFVAEGLIVPIVWAVAAAGAGPVATSRTPRVPAA